MIRTVLYVSGFSPNLRARDLAYEFERYGRLVRCDIPALKSPQSSPGSTSRWTTQAYERFANSPAFAFVEFRREDDAEDAYYDMHGRSIDGRRISVQWAKRPPSTAWRHDGASDDRRPPRDDRGYDRGHRDDRRAPPPRRRTPSPPPRSDRGRDYDRRDDRRSRSPVVQASRAREDRDRRGDSRLRDASPVRRSSRSPPPKGNGHEEPKVRGDDADERDD